MEENVVLIVYFNVTFLVCLASQCDTVIQVAAFQSADAGEDNGGCGRSTSPLLFLLLRTKLEHGCLTPTPSHKTVMGKKEALTVSVLNNTRATSSPD